MDQLKSMKETLMAAAQNQMGNLDNVNAKELGEVIDMIKDLEEAAYYCSVVKAMEKSEEEKKETEKYNTIATSMFNTAPVSQQYYTPYMNDRMYYDGRGGGNYGYSNNNSSGGNPSNGGYGGNSGNRGYYEGVYIPQSLQPRDYREGRSPISRRGYMEAKEMHKDKNVQMQELENYMQELSQDITEMINGATPEEKAILQQKLNTLMTKIK